MAIDEELNRLYVANFDFATGLSELVVFDFETAEIITRLPGPATPAFFNELAMDGEGTVYISDTFNPTVWYAPSDLSGVKELVTSDLLTNPDPDRPFGQNGIAITND